MSELYSYEFYGPTRVLWCGVTPEVRDSLAKSCEEQSIQLDTYSENESVQDVVGEEYQAIIIEIGKSEFQDSFEFLQKWRSLSPASSFLVLSNDLESDQIQRLVNEVEVFAIVEKFKSLAGYLTKAIVEYEGNRNYYGVLQKIKEQNNQLELLNKNLEDLVHERTKKEFHANQNAVDSLKKIQELLRFIKQVAQAETIEDLMTVVRKDFKKFHGLRPPMLCFSESQNFMRFFYFQGKQFTERLIKTEGLSIDEYDTAPLRKELSNLLGRPFGPIEVVTLEFKSPQMTSSFGVIFCEHSFDEDALEEFQNFSKERWSIVNLAIESLLLREKSHVIARQWAVTFNEMTDPILIIDKNYRINLDNSSLAKNEESYCFSEFAGRNKPCLGCPLTKTFADGEPHSADIHCLGKVFRAHSYPIHLDSSGRVSHVIHQYADITRFKDLQGKVVQGEKMAAIGMLAGNVAHELNNPLTGIHSLSGLLLDDLDKGSNTYKDLTEVKDAAERCQRIIKNLLEFSSLDGTSPAEIVEVNDMINKTLPMLKMAMRYHNNQILLSDTKLFVKVTPQLFQQVIFNLIHNACQAMEKGGDLIVQTFSDSDKCCIVIKDSGTGIPAEIKDHIFDPFFTTKEEGKGTGLGLSMSRTVVEKYGGSLKLSKSDSKGSEFLIELPLVEKTQ